MKWVAAVLMIMNVVIFLGVSDRQVASPQGQIDRRPDVNRESMLLLREVQPEQPLLAELPGSPTVVTAPDFSGMLEGGAPDSRDLALVSSVPGANIEPIDGAILESQDDGAAGATVAVDTDASAAVSENRDPVRSEESLITPPTEVAAIAPSLCYRVGPFKDAFGWQEARDWAAEQEIIYTPVRSASRELRAVRVYIGPFASIGATEQDVQILRDKELDYFVYLHDSTEARISLGYFTQEELAVKFVEYLVSEDISARSQPEYRTLGPFDWMDIDANSISRTAVLDRDWGDESVLVSERECGER